LGWFLREVAPPRRGSSLAPARSRSAREGVVHDEHDLTRRPVPPTAGPAAWGSPRTRRRRRSCRPAWRCTWTSSAWAWTPVASRLSSWTG